MSDPSGLRRTSALETFAALNRKLKNRGCRLVILLIQGRELLIFGLRIRRFVDCNTKKR